MPTATPAAALPTTIDPAIEAPSINKTQAAPLMQAIFPDTWRPSDNAAVLDIADGEDAGDWRMTLLAARTLPDGRTLAVVNGAPSDDTGADIPAHAAPGMLNVYLLRRVDGKAAGAWQVLERHQDVVTMGTFGSIGTVKWIMLEENRPGIVVSSGGSWFGSTIGSADIYELGHGVRSLGNFAEMSSNAGACRPDMPDCWEVDGKIGTVPAVQAQANAPDYRDIVVDFSGRHFRVTEDAQGKQTEHVTRTIRQRARYRFDGKQYVLISGANPVPDIES